MSSTHHVILDTDIGTDVDDALALAQIFGTPTIDLRAVTTAYGDTRLRAQLASRFCRAAEQHVPVFAGVRQTLSGREVWWAGHEGALHTNLSGEIIEDQDAISYMIEEVLSRPGEIDLVAIAPLTNIASAINAEPRFASSLRHLWVMGGAFDSTIPEHNIRSDVDAAQIVFAAGIPTTVTGVEMTRQVRLNRHTLERLYTPDPLGDLLRDEVEQWLDFRSEQEDVPHDCVTILTMVAPHLFELSGHGRVRIAENGSTSFEEDGGSTRIVTSLNALEVVERIVTDVRDAGVHADLKSGR